MLLKQSSKYLQYVQFHDLKHLMKTIPESEVESIDGLEAKVRDTSGISPEIDQIQLQVDIPAVPEHDVTYLLRHGAVTNSKGIYVWIEYFTELLKTKSSNYKEINLNTYPS